MHSNTYIIIIYKHHNIILYPSFIWVLHIIFIYTSSCEKSQKVTILYHTKLYVICEDSNLYLPFVHKTK